jgi:hypothetical protein
VKQEWQWKHNTVGYTQEFVRNENCISSEGVAGGDKLPSQMSTPWTASKHHNLHFPHETTSTGIKQTTVRKIWDFHGGDYEECRLLGYKNPFRTSQETHYVSATESSQLMLCKIWGFHGSDYEEWRFLGYKNPVRTSQETRYVSATDPCQLILCKIWGFQSSNYEECRLLGRYAVWLL